MPSPAFKTGNVTFLPDVNPSECGFAAYARSESVTPAKLAQLTSYTTTFRQWGAIFDPARIEEAGKTGQTLGDNYVFVDWEGGAEYSVFYFARKRTSGEALTAWRSYLDIEPSVYWPPVFRGLSWNNFLAYDSEGNSYVAGINWDPDIRDAYDGPCKVLIEEFISHEPHSIPVPSIMVPGGGTFYYGVGSFTLPRCLHPTFNLFFTTGTGNVKYPYQTFSKFFPSTNYTDWPSTFVISDTQQQVRNVWLRRRKTAYRP